MRGLLAGAAALGACAAVVSAGAPAGAAGKVACGLPGPAPVWIDYGQPSVTPDVRAVFARPGVVVASSGTVVPAEFRSKGAATAYFVLHLSGLVGQPSAPADPAALATAAAKLLAQAQASTACPTPWIALNELFGAAAPTPWPASTARYRADLLTLVRLLAAGGAHPVLLVNGNPNVTGNAARWWRRLARSADVVYEAYYNGAHIYSLGPLLGNRRMRLGMRSIVARFEGIGIPATRLGLMLAFHSGAPSSDSGRQGLEPREAWLRVVKWEALAARHVASETHVASIWSWGWATFGAGSADPDKAAAACVWLWARRPSLCDGPAAGGPAFNTSLVEGQIVLPAGATCRFAGGNIAASAVNTLAAFSRNRHEALTALFARAALRKAEPVTSGQVAAVERRAIARVFHGSRRAYRRALARSRATVAIARGVIRDELRRRAIAARLGSHETTLRWADDTEATAADTAVCLHDDLPGSGAFPATDAREIGVVPLLARLRFLLGDRTPPVSPAALAATASPGAVSLAWAYGSEPDLAGYEVFRAAASGGPYRKLTGSLLPRPAFTDTTAPTGARSYYVVRAVDTSGNQSAPSAEATAAPA